MLTLEVHMTEEVEGILAQLTAVHWIAVLGALAIVTIGLANFADAIKRIHDFWKGVSGKLRNKVEPGPENQRQFEELRRNVLYCGLTNRIPVELHKLRDFLIKSGVIENPPFRQFFDRWLSSPPVLLGIEVANAFSYAEIAELEKELRDLKF